MSFKLLFFTTFVAFSLHAELGTKETILLLDLEDSLSEKDRSATFDHCVTGLNNPNIASDSKLSAKLRKIAISSASNALGKFSANEEKISSDWILRTQQIPKPQAEDDGDTFLFYAHAVWCLCNDDVKKLGHNNSQDNKCSIVLAQLRECEAFAQKAFNKGTVSAPAGMAEKMLKTIKTDISTLSNFQKLGKQNMGVQKSVSLKFIGDGIQSIRVFNVDASGKETRRPADGSPANCDLAKQSEAKDENTSWFTVNVLNEGKGLAGVYGYEATFVQILDRRLTTKNLTGKRTTFKGRFTIPSGSTMGNLRFEKFRWEDAQVELSTTFK